MNGKSTALTRLDPSELRIHPAQDVSSAVLFSLERQHIDYLNLQAVPAPQALRPPTPSELFFMHLTQVGHGPDIERSLDLTSLQNILGCFRDGAQSLVFALGSDGVQSRLHLGARRLLDDEVSSGLAFDFVQNLRRAIEGNLPGTRFQDYTASSQDGKNVTCPPGEVFDHITYPLQSYPYLAALTGIPSLRGERQHQFTQSLDRFAQALQGQRYLLLIIAEPIPERQVNEVLLDCLRLNSEVHSWVKTGASLSQATSEAEAKGVATGRVTGGAEGQVKGGSHSSGSSHTPNAAVGGLLGAGLSLMLAPLIGGAAVAVGNMTSSLVTRRSGTVSDNISESESTSLSKTWSDSVTESLNRTVSNTSTSSLSVENLNKTAEYCEKLIDGYIQRLQRAKNLGMWNAGVYFLADDPATFAQGRTQLQALYSGRETYFEPMRTVDLSAPGVRRNIGMVLATFSNPILDLQIPGTGEPLRHPLGKLHRGLSTPLNTEELALLMNLPRREIPGLRLEMVADFGVNPRPLSSQTGIPLGKVVSGGVPLDIPIGLETQDLTRHTFVTGITGGGKTNTCFALLKAVTRRQVPFLVIEPAKGEYRSLLGDPDFPDLRIYTLGDETVSPFRINPFQFVPGMNLITHLDNLKAIFNAAFPMYASMPYMLEEAIVRCYEDCGWDLVHSTNTNVDMADVVANWERGEPDYRYARYLPTLSALMEKIDVVVTSKGYAQEATSNYAAALKARISSLILGSKGRMLNTQRGVPFEELFGSPTVLELRSVGDDDEKCFLMALLLVQLYEYRELQYHWGGQPAGLRHLTVLEESHRLLGRGGTGGSLEVANPRGKAVESFANLLAEIREYGEGFLVVDQTPVKLIPDVIKNTSTKILHRITARDDRDVMGDAMSMTEEQKKMVPRLRVGDAIFHTQDQDKPIWIKIPALKGSRALVSNAAIRAHMERHHEKRAEQERLVEKRRRAEFLGRLADFNERLRQAAS